MDAQNPPLQSDNQQEIQTVNEPQNPQVIPNPENKTVKVEEIIQAPEVPGASDQIVTTPQTEALSGEIVESKPKHPGGRPTKYSEEMLRKTNYYFDLCRGKIDKQHRFPYIEELAMELDVDEDTINNWAKEHEEYFGAIKRIKTLQKLKLMHRGFKATNPTFSIFMLKVNHGFIETEKRILAGERNSDPLQITIKDYTPAARVAETIADNATS